MPIRSESGLTWSAPIEVPAGVSAASGSGSEVVLAVATSPTTRPEPRVAAATMAIDLPNDDMMLSVPKGPGSSPPSSCLIADAVRR
jgi:hypothetical protein